MNLHQLYHKKPEPINQYLFKTYPNELSNIVGVYGNSNPQVLSELKQINEWGESEIDSLLSCFYPKFKPSEHYHNVEESALTASQMKDEVIQLILASNRLYPKDSPKHTLNVFSIYLETAENINIFESKKAINLRKRLLTLEHNSDGTSMASKIFDVLRKELDIKQRKMSEIFKSFYTQNQKRLIRLAEKTQSKKFDPETTAIIEKIGISSTLSDGFYNYIEGKGVKVELIDQDTYNELLKPDIELNRAVQIFKAIQRDLGMTTPILTRHLKKFNADLVPTLEAQEQSLVDLDDDFDLDSILDEIDDDLERSPDEIQQTKLDTTEVDKLVSELVPYSKQGTLILVQKLDLERNPKIKINESSQDKLLNLELVNESDINTFLDSIEGLDQQTKAIILQKTIATVKENPTYSFTDIKDIPFDRDLLIELNKNRNNYRSTVDLSRIQDVKFIGFKETDNAKMVLVNWYMKSWLHSNLIKNDKRDLKTFKDKYFSYKESKNRVVDPVLHKLKKYGLPTEIIANTFSVVNIDEEQAVFQVAYVYEKLKGYKESQDEKNARYLTEFKTKVNIQSELLIPQLKSELYKFDTKDNIDQLFEIGSKSNKKDISVADGVLGKHTAMNLLKAFDFKTKLEKITTFNEGRKAELDKEYNLYGRSYDGQENSYFDINISSNPFLYRKDDGFRVQVADFIVSQKKENLYKNFIHVLNILLGMGELTKQELTKIESLPFKFNAIRSDRNGVTTYLRTKLTKEQQKNLTLYLANVRYFISEEEYPIMLKNMSEFINISLDELDIILKESVSETKRNEVVKAFEEEINRFKYTLSYIEEKDFYSAALRDNLDLVLAYKTVKSGDKELKVLDGLLERGVKHKTKRDLLVEGMSRLLKGQGGSHNFNSTWYDTEFKNDILYHDGVFNAIYKSNLIYESNQHFNNLDFGVKDSYLKLIQLLPAQLRGRIPSPKEFVSDSFELSSTDDLYTLASDYVKLAGDGKKALDDVRILNSAFSQYVRDVYMYREHHNFINVFLTKVKPYTDKLNTKSNLELMESAQSSFNEAKEKMATSEPYTPKTSPEIREPITKNTSDKPSDKELERNAKRARYLQSFVKSLDSQEDVVKSLKVELYKLESKNEVDYLFDVINDDKNKVDLSIHFSAIKDTRANTTAKKLLKTFDFAKEIEELSTFNTFRSKELNAKYKLYGRDYSKEHNYFNINVNTNPNLYKKDDGFRVQVSDFINLQLKEQVLTQIYNVLMTGLISEIDPKVTEYTKNKNIRINFLKLEVISTFETKIKNLGKFDEFTKFVNLITSKTQIYHDNDLADVYFSEMAMHLDMDVFDLLALYEESLNNPIIDVSEIIRKLKSSFDHNLRLYLANKNFKSITGYVLTGLEHTSITYGSKNLNITRSFWDNFVKDNNKRELIEHGMELILKGDYTNDAPDSFNGSNFNYTVQNGFLYHDGVFRAVYDSELYQGATKYSNQVISDLNKAYKEVLAVLPNQLHSSIPKPEYLISDRFKLSNNDSLLTLLDDHIEMLNSEGEKLVEDVNFLLEKLDVYFKEAYLYTEHYKFMESFLTKVKAYSDNIASRSDYMIKVNQVDTEFKRAKSSLTYTKSNQPVSEPYIPKTSPETRESITQNTTDKPSDNELDYESKLELIGNALKSNNLVSLSKVLDFEPVYHVGDIYVYDYMLTDKLKISTKLELGMKSLTGDYLYNTKIYDIILNNDLINRCKELRDDAKNKALSNFKAISTHDKVTKVVLPNLSSLFNQDINVEFNKLLIHISDFKEKKRLFSVLKSYIVNYLDYRLYSEFLTGFLLRVKLSQANPIKYTEQLADYVDSDYLKLELINQLKTAGGTKLYTLDDFDTEEKIIYELSIFQSKTANKRLNSTDIKRLLKVVKSSSKTRIESPNISDYDDQIKKLANKSRTPFNKLNLDYGIFLTDNNKEQFYIELQRKFPEIVGNDHEVLAKFMFMWWLAGNVGELQDALVFANKQFNITILNLSEILISISERKKAR